MAEKTTTRRLILEAAITCIEKVGIDQVTTRMIAQEAGANTAAINYYFRSKDDLIAETLSMTIHHMMEDVFLAIDKPDQAFETTLENVLFYLLDGALRFPGVTRAHLYKAIMDSKADTVSAPAVRKVFDRLVQRAVQEYPDKDPKQVRLRLAQILSAIMFTMLAPGFLPVSREYQLNTPRHARTVAQAYTRLFVSTDWKPP